jgi:uncharacterized protein YebE (UPF0316 family)
VRVVFIARQQLWISAILAFFESAIFAYTVANVVNDLNNWRMFFAYSLGFAVGSYLGMWLEKWFVTTFMTVNVIVHHGGHAIALKLREAGFGVTESTGEGKDGLVTMLRSIVDRRDVMQVNRLIREANPDAFITVEETRSIRQGFVRHASPIR